jgi:toxin HigB-1
MTLYNTSRYRGPVIVSFRDEGTEDIYYGDDSRAARKVLPTNLHKIAVRKLDLMDKAKALKDLASPAGMGLHPLRGDRRGQHAVKVNDQYRICFRWTDEGPADVEITDYL